MKHYGFVKVLAIALSVSFLFIAGCATPGEVRRMENDISTLKKKLKEGEAKRKEEAAKLKADHGAQLKKKAENYDAQLKRAMRTHKTEVDTIKKDKTREIKKVEREKDRELDRLKSAKERLAKELKGELAQYQAKLEMSERGLIITFLAEVFFDSGKAVVKDENVQLLDKVAKVLNEKVPDSKVAVEGHTDNVPITVSSWHSNWELSCHRALAVLHYFVDKCNVLPSRLSANGYGEYRPVVANDTKEGRQQNRRVEIVIMPAKLSKEKGEL